MTPNLQSLGLSWRRCKRWRAAACALTMVVASVSAAAGQQEAAIIGQVTDESGALLPGVTVTASSPALQVQSLTVVTDQTGEYRVSPLPIGTYEVTYSLSGFQGVRRPGLRLTVGFVAKVDAVLKVGSLEETVTVSGASPVVDVTSTGSSTRMTRETIEAIPTGRNGVISVLAQAPGVVANLDIGGNTAGDVPAIRAYGLTSEAQMTMDGILTSSSKTTQSGNFYDYSVFEETRVQAVTNEVDVPLRGVNITTVLKSGSNKLHMGAFLAQTNSNFQSQNFDDELAAQGVTQAGGKLLTRWDRSAEVGGKLVENRLWGYLSTRWRRSNETVTNVVKDDGSPGDQPSSQGWHTEKVTYHLSAKNQIDGFHQWQWKLNADSGPTAFIPWESRQDLEANVHVAGVRWQGTPTSSLVTSLQVGFWDFQNEYTAKAAPGRVATEDIVTLYRTGASQIAGTYAHERRNQATGTLTWYRPGLYRGNHELKAGFDYNGTYIRRSQLSRGDYGNYVLLYSNGAPFQIRTQNSPVDPKSASNYLAAYARDNWTIGRRLTLNLGARFVHDHGFVPEQCRPDSDPPAFGPATCQSRVDLASWNSVAPRLYASWDVSGGGKTVVKGGWGRFDHPREVEEVSPFNSLTPTVTTWTWRDLNGDRLYQPGEVDLSPNSRDFISSTPTSFAGSFSNGVINPDEKETKLDQFSVSLEHELMANFALRLTGMHTRNFNLRRVANADRPYSVFNIPISNLDPGPDGVLGTADDSGRTFTYYDYPAALAGQRFERSMYVTPPGQQQTFDTIEVSGEKRLSNRWQFMAAYSATKNHAPFAEELALNPNAEINASNETWEWVGKSSASYAFPLGLTASTRYEHRSGAAQARTVLFRGGKQIPTLVVTVDPIGSLRLPNINTVDVRLEKNFRVQGTHRISLWLNVYNALNSNAVTARTLRSGATYLRPTAFLSPRIAELSVQYRF